MGHERISLKRECSAVAIPSGEPVMLPVGAEVTLTQSLGGSHTVMTAWGQLVRIEGKDADALGLGGPQDAAGDAHPAPATALDRETTEKVVWDLLRTCYDPEIPVNIVDLGLIYKCVVSPAEPEGHRVDVTMTLTAPGCGMGVILKQDVESKVRSVPGVKEASVELVNDPPWNPNMMSEAAKVQLGFV
ncbi:MAG: putative Fe-S cluster assembly protein SufT [Acidobacteriota bacterium]